MQEHTLIANSGIQIITFPLSINTQEKFKCGIMNGMILKWGMAT